MDDPYNIYGGFQDHDSWKGPSNSTTGRITLEHWVAVGPGDGMYNVVDPTDSRWVYNTRELNQMGRLDQRTGVRTNIAPTRAAGQPRLRYNWIAPIALSPHRPHDERRLKDWTERPVLHHHVNLGVAAPGRHHLGGHRRWQGAADTESRRGLDGHDGGIDSRRRES
jgi:hypothetical protein